MDRVICAFMRAHSVTQLCLTLCNPMNCSPPGSSVLGILQARQWKVKVKVIPVVSDSLWSYGLYPSSLLCPCDSSAKNTRVDCHSFFQGTFPIQDWTWVSCIAGKFFTFWATTRLPERVAISFSRGSSQCRDLTHVSCSSCIGSGILYHWATWEALELYGW